MRCLGLSRPISALSKPSGRVHIAAEDREGDLQSRRSARATARAHIVSGLQVGEENIVSGRELPRAQRIRVFASRYRPPMKESAHIVPDRGELGTEAGARHWRVARLQCAGYEADPGIPKALDDVAGCCRAAERAQSPVDMLGLHVQRLHVV